jgi:hypothetical protein
VAGTGEMACMAGAFVDASLGKAISRVMVECDFRLLYPVQATRGERKVLVVLGEMVRGRMVAEMVQHDSPFLRQ